MAITATNLGSANGVNTTLADRTALFLKTFSGEVLNAFDKKNIGLALVKSRTVTQSKSVQFPVTGALADTTTAHVPGADVSTDTMTFNERVITIDQRYYKSVFIDDFEDKMSHYETRGEIAKQMAEAIATKIDKAIFAGVYDAGVNGTALAGTSQQDGQVSIVTELKGGAATAQAAGDALIAELFDIQASLNQRDVPMEGRTFVTDSPTYYKLLQSTRGINQDFTSGKNGGIDSGEIMNIAGFQILWTNHLPFVDYAVPVAGESKVKGLVFTPDVFGVAKFMDVTSEANYIPEKLGTLMTSYYALGMGLLDPTSAVAIVAE